MIANPSALRGVVAGAGAAMFCELQIIDATLALTKKAADKVVVCYLGTATYDLVHAREKQTSFFTHRGAIVKPLDVASATPPPAAVEAALDEADVVLVSGGNTLFAMDRWKHCGVVEPLRRAMDRGAVLCGGSAGAGCWFDGLHSDSMDPETYRKIMLAGAGGGAEAEAGAAPAKPCSGGVMAPPPRPWSYVRVSCLGFLPGLCCPHHNRVQVNPHCSPLFSTTHPSHHILRSCPRATACFA